MMLNAFDVDPGAAERTLELQSGELFELGIQADLLVISARAANYDPVEGTLVQRLEQACGLQVGALPREFDLTHGLVGAWVSPPLSALATPVHWPVGSATRFQRIAVVESPGAADQNGSGQDPWPVFNQLFSLLAILPLQGIHCSVVASPLLSAGNQKVAPDRLFPGLLERCRSGFRHVPDLDRLIVFDRQQEPLERLAEQIDHELGRYPSERELIDLSSSDGPATRLRAVLEGFPRIHGQFKGNADINELLHLLAGESATAMALGIHGRRLAERLVLEHLGWRRGPLYQGIQTLSHTGLDPWLISCLHQVRVFGNWMGHPSRPGQRKAVSNADVSAMLAALLRVVEDYPW